MKTKLQYLKTTIVLFLVTAIDSSPKEQQQQQTHCLAISTIDIILEGQTEMGVWRAKSGVSSHIKE